MLKNVLRIDALEVRFWGMSGGLSLWRSDAVECPEDYCPGC